MARPDNDEAAFLRTDAGRKLMREMGLADPAEDAAEELSFSLDEAPPTDADGGEVMDVEAPAGAARTTPRTPRLRVDPGDEFAASIQRLRGEFDEKIVLGSERVESCTEAFSATVKRFLQQCERLMEVFGTMTMPPAERYRINEVRRDVLQSRGDVTLALQHMVAVVRRQEANLAEVMANAVNNHLCRGDQLAPLLVHAAREESNLGFLADNPALPRPLYALRAMETRRMNLL